MCLLMAAALANASCFAGTAEDAPPARPIAPEELPPATGGRLVVSVPNESNGWNPFINQWSDSQTLVGTSMIEPLAIQENDGRAQPWLAERWEPNADFTQWDITLRTGVVFHDGTPFDAVTAKKSLEKLFQSGLYSLQFGPLYDRVEVTGPTTVRVYLKVRWAQYPTSLAYAWMLAPSMLNRPDEGTSNPVGTGPFRFVQWTPERSLTTSRFEHYWRKDPRGAALPYLDALEFRLIRSNTDRATALRAGEIDLALSEGVDDAATLQDRFEILKDYSTQRTFLLLNTAPRKGQTNPFANAHARRALALAVDRRRIAAKIGPDVKSTTFGFRPDSPWAPAGPDGYPGYDPQAARRELDLYRKETGASALRFTLHGQTAPEFQETMQAVKENLAEVGIVANIKLVDFPQIGTLAVLGDFDASLGRMHDFPDPDQLSFFYSSATLAPAGTLSLNMSRYTSPRLDANLRVLRETTDFTRRKAANDDVIRETNGAVVNVWLYDTPALLVASRNVRGLAGFRTHYFANALPKPWSAELSLDRAG